MALGSPVEDLGLSVRTRNALRSIACNTIEDVLGLDFSTPVRGIGRKAKQELLTKLGRAGFRHPALQQQPVTDARMLERSLERIERRIDVAFGAVTKDIRLLRQRLQKNSA